MLSITASYAGLLALLFLALSVRTIRYRRSARIGLGDNGDRELIRRMRAHANLAEYGPLALILLGLVEVTGSPIWLVHALGLMLVLSRGMHAVGFSRKPQVMALRVWGMGLTLLMILLSALWLIARSFI